MNFMQSKNAWLSPTGNLYPVGKHQHESEIYGISGLDQDDAIRHGWIKISDGVAYYAWCRRSVTEEQLQTLAALAADWGIEFYSIFDLFTEKVKRYLGSKIDGD